MSAADAEALLKKVRKMEANKVCPNCGTTAPTGLGFGSICIKFKTFVCDNCKASHAAYSHRCKSVAMSTWTMEEVLSLTSEYNGGNLAALHNWLHSAPAFGERYTGGSRPQKGDRIDVFKQFIVDCYEKGMFKATTPFEPPAAGSTPRAAPAKPASSPAARRAAPAPAAPTPAASVNFFDDDFGQPPQQHRHSSAPATMDPFFSSGTSSDPFGAATTTSSASSGFDFMNAAPSTATAAAAFSPPAPPSDDFFGASNGSQSNNFFAQPVQQSSTDFFGQPSVPSNVPPVHTTQPGTDFFSQPAAPTHQPSTDFFSQPSPQSNPIPVAPPSSSSSFDVFGSDFLMPSTSSAAPMQQSPGYGGHGIGGHGINSGNSSSARGGGGMAISSMMSFDSPVNAGNHMGYGGTSGMGGRAPADNFDFVRDSLGQSRGGRGGGQPMGGMSMGPASMQGGGMNPNGMRGGMMPPPMMNRGTTYPAGPNNNMMGNWGAPQQQQGWGQR